MIVNIVLSMKLSIKSLQASIILWLIVILTGAVSTVFLDPIFTGGNKKAISNLVDNFRSEKKLSVNKYYNDGKYELVKPPKEYDGSIRFYYNDKANQVQATKEEEEDETKKKKLAELELKYREQGFKALY